MWHTDTRFQSPSAIVNNKCYFVNDFAAVVYKGMNVVAKLGKFYQKVLCTCIIKELYLQISLFSTGGRLSSVDGSMHFVNY